MPGGGDMTSYIRRYATYLNEKRDAYKLMGYDFCKIKRGFVLLGFALSFICRVFPLGKKMGSCERCQRKR